MLPSFDCGAPSSAIDLGIALDAVRFINKTAVEVRTIPIEAIAAMIRPHLRIIANSIGCRDERHFR